MSLRYYTFLLFSSMLIALGLFIFLLFSVDPYQADILQKSLFFASIFIILLGSITLINFYLKVSLSNREVIFSQLKPAFRQGFLIAAGAVFLLFLQTIRVLSVWEAIILVVALILIELYFRRESSKKSKQ